MDDLDDFMLYNAIEDDREEEEREEELDEETTHPYTLSEDRSGDKASKWDNVENVLGRDGCLGCLVPWIEVMLFTLFLFWLVQSCDDHMFQS